jgi:tRNA(Ile)-lysidine synthase
MSMRAEARPAPTKADQTPPLARALEARIRAHHLLAPGDRIVLALSGGADSVVLLHLLRFPLAHLQLHITAAHYDHAMRANSAADARWVSGLCRAWEAPLVRGRARRVLASEADARSARYHFLRKVRHARDARFVLTAHHADDQLETIIFRIMRGAGTRGLAGMLEQRGHLMRPLLSFHREEIRAYAREAGIRFREDQSNSDVRFARNRLRHEIVPQIESFLPGASRELLDLATRARAHERAWKPLVREAFRSVVTPLEEGGFMLARLVLLEYHPEVGARVIRALVRRLGCALDRAGTQAAVQFIRSASSGAVLELSGGVRLQREFDRLRVFRWPGVSSPPQDVAPNVVIEAAGSGSAELVLGGRKVRLNWTLGEDFRFPLEVRGWRPGDRIRLPYGTKKLKKLFAEQRIPRAERSRIPLLIDSDETVLWVRGVACAADVPSADDADFQILVSDA